MVLQPRDNNGWWVDQYGNRRSNFWLWRAEQAGDLSKVMVDEETGVRLEATPDGDILHLIEIPSYDTLMTMDHRALLTDTERELIANPAADNVERRDQAVARVRWRIINELPDDIETLRQYQPTLYEKLRTTVRRDDS